MRYPAFKSLLWLGILFLVVGLACGVPSDVTDTPEPTEPGEEEISEASEEEPSESESTSGAVSNLQDVRQAVIQIEAQGTFVDPQVGEYVGAGRGTGFIIDPSGIAVTNNHVVTGAALLKVWVGGDTLKTYNAKVLGVSECSDLAVIDIDGAGFPFLEWNTEPIEVGREVYAAGFPLGDTEYTITKGIISKENADGETDWASVDSVIMHDATINPGNSGGPLITTDGKVMGVNYATIASANQYFAIGRQEAMPIIEELRAGNDVESIGVNGVAVVSQDGSLSGVWVTSVASGSPADKAGITGGDIIMTLEDLPLATDGTMADYCDVIRTHQPTDTMSLEVLRFASNEILAGQLNGEPLSTAVTLEETEAETGTGTGTEQGDSEEEPPAFFVEEFETEFLENWSWFITNGDENEFGLYTENGRLVFDLTGSNLFTYVAYDPWLYQSVRVDAIAENRGRNSNNVGLICHLSEEGWYEFSISNGGEWWIWAFDETTDQYSMLANGGSTAVRMGKDTNQYSIVCDGNTLSLAINGQQTHTMTDTNFAFREGQVGIGVSSFDVLPIVLEFDWISISQP